MRGFNECHSRLLEIESDLRHLEYQGYRIYGEDGVAILAKVHGARQHLITAERAANPLNNLPPSARLDQFRAEVESRRA